MREGMQAVAGSPWQRAYLFALYVSLAVAGITILIWGFGVQVRLVNVVVASIMGTAYVIAGFRLAGAGGILAALPYVLIGSGIFFGFGAVVSVYNTESMAQLSFTDDVLRAILPKVNAANAIAIALVVASAGPFCMGFGRRNGATPGLDGVIRALLPSFRGLMVISIPVVLVTWATFPTPGSLVLASLLAIFRGVPLFTILLGAAIWGRLPGMAKMLVLLLTFSLALVGFLGLSKLNTILPVIMLVLGWWLSGAMRKQALVLAALLMAFYFGGLAEIVGVGRFNSTYDPVKNSIEERAIIVVETARQLSDLTVSGDDSFLLNRFTLAPFQAYFMSLYDSGAPGDSLQYAGVVLVPRALWPDKPIIQPGAEFDLIFRGYESESHLGISFVAEAYWNLGWPGLVLISIMVGVTAGWFTRKWLLFAEHGAAHLGIFLFAPLVLLASGAVERSIVTGHIGGMVKLALVIMMVDITVRAVQGRKAQHEITMKRPI